jgi:integrase
MGYLYRPKLKDPTPLPPCKHPDPTHAGEKHPDHGRTDVCPGCGARFSPVWWIKYYDNGKAVRESTETEKETVARQKLKTQEGKVATGQPILPRVNKILYDEAAKDLRLHYKTTGERDLDEAEARLLHLDAFFLGRRLSAIKPADLTGYVAARQADGAANGTINRELGVLGRMLRLAYENEKLLRLPLIRKLTEAAPRSGFFERTQFEAVKRHLPADLQVAVTIQYAFGWRTKSEVLTLKRSQVDLGACTLRLDPGTTKNDDGRVVSLTPELVDLLQAQDDRVMVLEATSGKNIPHLFPHLSGKHKGKPINDFRKAWTTACIEATLDLEGLSGTARTERKTALVQAVAKGEKPGLLKMIRHDFRRTAVRNMVNRGVPERVAMTVTGHKTRAVFDRYHIVSPGDLRDVARKLTGTFSGTLPVEKDQGVPCTAGTP